MNHPNIGDFVNVYHWRIALMSTSTDENINDAILERMEDLYSPFLGFMSDSLNFSDINIFNVTQDMPIGSFPWPTISSGTGGSGESLPPQVAYFIRGLSGFSRNWAKKFIGPFLETASAGSGVVQAAVMTAGGTFATNWLASLMATGGARLESVVYHASAGLWRELVEAVSTNIWATFRTRRHGRGA
jgi:hypothetical protein